MMPFALYNALVIFQISMFSVFSDMVECFLEILIDKSIFFALIVDEIMMYYFQSEMSSSQV